MTREEQENRKLENQMKRVNETALLCTEFLLTNASDIDLSNKTGISSSTVGRRLTNQNNILLAYSLVKNNLIKAGLNEEDLPKNGIELFELIAKRRQENLLRGKALGGQTTLLNHVYLKEENSKFNGVTKLSLSAFYSDKEKQYRFLINAALYFKLHLDTLSKLFQIDEKEILDNMLKISEDSFDSLKVLFYHDGKNQDVARIEFMNYYRELLDAVRHKNNEDKKRLISLIGDSKAAELKRKRKPGTILSDEDIEILIRYQLKYALTTHSISYIFEINRSNYQARVNKFLATNENLRKEYEYLMDYNSSKYVSGGRRG